MCHLLRTVREATLSPLPHLPRHSPQPLVLVALEGSSVRNLKRVSQTLKFVITGKIVRMVRTKQNVVSCWSYRCEEFDKMFFTKFR
jgi:hypothetical protein